MKITKQDLQKFSIEELRVLDKLISPNRQTREISNEYIPLEFGGNRPGNVLQDFTFDYEGRIYTTHDPSSGNTSNDDAAVISKLTPYGELCPHDDWCIEGAGSHDGIITSDDGWKGFGHGQGISYESYSGPDKLWATCNKCPTGEYNTGNWGNRGTAYRFSREYMGYIDVCEDGPGHCREEFQIFDTSYNNLMVSLSQSENYLVASAKKQGTYYIKIFNKPDDDWNTHEVDNDGVWVSDYPMFSIPNPEFFQGIAIDDNRIYCQFGNSNPNSDKHLYVYDFNGDEIEHRIHTIGKDWATSINPEMYEPEGLAFKGNQLYIGIVSGYSSERQKALFPVKTKIRPKQQQQIT